MRHPKKGQKWVNKEGFYTYRISVLGNLDTWSEEGKKILANDLLRGELQGTFPVLPFIIKRPIEEFRRPLVEERLDPEDVHSSSYR